MTHEGRLFPVFGCDGDLPVAGIAIQCREDGRLAEAVNAFLHPGKRVGVLLGHDVQQAILDAEAEGAVLLGNEYDREAPFGRCRLDDVRFQRPLDLGRGTMSWTPLAMVLLCVVNRREAPNTWPRPAHMVRTQTTEAADGGSRVLQVERSMHETRMERSSSSSGPRTIAVTEPSVQRMDRSWGRMACALSSMNAQPRMTGTDKSSTTRKVTGTIRAPVCSRGCHGYIPEEYVHALYPYPLRIRAEDAYPKCIMRKNGEVISILSNKNCDIISHPYPRYESQDTGIYKIMKLLAPAEF